MLAVFKMSWCCFSVVSDIIDFTAYSSFYSLVLNGQTEVSCFHSRRRMLRHICRAHQESISTNLLVFQQLQIAILQKFWVLISQNICSCANFCCIHKSDEIMLQFKQSLTILTLSKIASITEWSVNQCRCN